MQSSCDLGFGCEGNGGRGVLSLPVPGQDTGQLILKYWNRGLLSVLLGTVLLGSPSLLRYHTYPYSSDVGKEAWNLVMALTPHSLRLGQD